MRLRYIFIPLDFLCFILGGGSFLLLGFAIGSLHLPNIVLALSPPDDLIVFCIVCSEFDGLAHGIIEQVEVGWVMDVGLNDKGVTASRQRFFFFSD